MLIHLQESFEVVEKINNHYKSKVRGIDRLNHAKILRTVMEQDCLTGPSQSAGLISVGIENRVIQITPRDAAEDKCGGKSIK